jgi:Dolichyl-phosphate-mannose-protein mannosyltransferase
MTTTAPGFFTETPAPHGPLSVPFTGAPPREAPVPARTLVRRRFTTHRSLNRSSLRCVPTRVFPLGALLSVEAAQSIHLARSNTIFLDEAVYLGAGRQLIQTWLHGGPDMHFSTYFSGAPVIYPVLGALINAVGGLFAARMFSLIWVLGATVFVYACTRRLYGTTAGWLAAAAFTTVEGTLFLGSLATFDAMSLGLLALAAWIVIRAGTSGSAEPHPTIYLAAPVLVLANATKYASTLYDVVIIGIALLVVAAHHGRTQAIKVGTVLVALTAALISASLALAGPDYVKGITSTTVSRPEGVSSVATVTHDTVLWIGALVALAVVAGVTAVVAAARRRTTWSTVAMAGLLVSATILAPLNQARIHTTVSLDKHVDFGAWFGAILVGWFLSRLAGVDRRNAWRWPLVACVLIPLSIVGSRQATGQFQTWANSERVIDALGPIVEHTHGAILVDEAQVPAYYLAGQVSSNRWFNTFYLRYTPPGSNVARTGIPAYVSAIQHDAFAVVALGFEGEQSVDDAVARAMARNPAYHVVTKVPVHDAYGTSAYVIWRLQGS